MAKIKNKRDVWRGADCVKGKRHYNFRSLSNYLSEVNMKSYSQLNLYGTRFIYLFFGITLTNKSHTVEPGIFIKEVKFDFMLI